MFCILMDAFPTIHYFINIFWRTIINISFSEIEEAGITWLHLVTEKMFQVSIPWPYIKKNHASSHWILLGNVAMKTMTLPSLKSSPSKQIHWP